LVELVAWEGQYREVSSWRKLLVQRLHRRVVAVCPSSHTRYIHHQRHLFVVVEKLGTLLGFGLGKRGV
jgi:hypothetical protein